MTGEKLGTIGQVGDGDSKLSSLPRWKKELLGKQSILIRKGIAWVSRVGVDNIHLS